MHEGFVIFLRPIQYVFLTTTTVNLKTIPIKLTIKHYRTLEDCGAKSNNGNANLTEIVDCFIEYFI